MIIVEVSDFKSLDKALKHYKMKVIKTKQMDILYSNREYVKKSVKRRTEINKAKYNQKKKDLD